MNPNQTIPPDDMNVGPTIGLTRVERERATLLNLVRAAMADDRKELSFWRELSEATRAKTGQQQLGATSLLIPGDVLRRDMTVASGAGEGYLVGLGPAGFSDALRKASILGRLPVQRHNLTGNGSIAVKTVQHSTTWIAVDGVSQIGDAQATYGQTVLTPHSVAATLTLSAQMIRQLDDGARTWIDAGLAAALAEAVDAALLHGTGANGQPRGLHTVTGIDTRAGTSFALSDAIAMLKVCEGFATDATAWVAGVDTAAVLRARAINGTGSAMLLAGDGRMLGSPVVVSRSAGAATLTVADWTKLHFAQWGALELGVDPMTNFATGKVVIRAIWMVDFAHERPAQVAVGTALT